MTCRHRRPRRVVLPWPWQAKRPTPSPGGYNSREVAFGTAPTRCAMTQPVPRDVLAKVRKLALLPHEARHSRFAVSVTRLTVLKSLCQEPRVANRFVTHLARKALAHAESGRRHSRPPPGQDRAHRRMMAEALAEMEG